MNDYQRPTQYPPGRQPVQPGIQYTIAWYKQQRKIAQIGLGCLSLFVAFFFCIACSGISNAVVNGTAQVVPTPTHQLAQTAHQSPAKTSSTVPQAIKPTATPKPTQIPPTAIPTTAPVQIAPTQAPAPIVPTQAPVPAGPTYNTDPTGGSTVYTTPDGFCTSHTCIGNFANGTGYIVECGNGGWSHSGGKTGACSKDGGVVATLYQH